MSLQTTSIENILAEAVDIADDQKRRAFIEQACGKDIELRRQVERLVANHFQAGSFLDAAASQRTANHHFPNQTEALGTSIGPYKLIEQIGEGGMGTVYMAEQREPVRRKVALKIVKLGMDSKQVVARFEAERQALAMMDHPNIAKVFDGGNTATGRPYFVMELVRGIPITEYCDQRKLTIRERLELFVKVCQAVQHAHQKGIIHRDLKPTNVLVELHDVVAIPKVIDFGIAKATAGQLTEKTLVTGFAQMLGTPLYMSPEQAELSGLDVDTRSDVYALGVLLYELLTGSTPFAKERLRQAGYDEIRRIIREEEPPRPSQRLSTLLAEARSTVSQKRRLDERQIGRHLQGELDWIVMRAVEKDRIRRYGSVSDLAQDIQRYLHNEPVEACPPSVVYRLKKFARRHRMALFTSSLVAAALILGTGLSLWQAIAAWEARQTAETNFRNAEEQRQQALLNYQEAEKQRNLADRNAARAEREFKKSLQAVERMLLRVGDKRLASIPQAEPVRQELFKDAIEFYEGFLQEHQADPKLQFEIAKAWANLSDLQGFEGRQQEDLASKTKALKILEQMRKEHPSDLKLLEFMAETTWGLAHVLHFGTIDRRAGERAFLRALELRKEIERLSPTDSTNRFGQARIRGALGDLYIVLSDLNLAEEHLLQAQKIVRQVVSESSSADWLNQRSYVNFVLASLYCNNYGRTQEGEELFLEAIRFGELALHKDPQLADIACQLGRTYSTYAQFLDQHDRAPEAESKFKRSLEILAQLNREHPNFQNGRTFLARSLSSAIENLKKLGKLKELAVIAELLPRNIQGYQARSKAYEALGELDRALAASQQSVGLVQQLVADFPGEAQNRAELNSAYAELGETLQRLTKVTDAEQAFRTALDISEKLTTEFPSNAYFWRQYGHSHMRLAKLLSATARRQEALQEIQKALVIQERLVAENPGGDNYRRDLETAHVELVHQRFEIPGFGPSHPDFREALSDLANFCKAHPDLHFFHYAHALASCAAGESEGYRRDCANMLALYIKAKKHNENDFTLWTCALGPNSLDDYARAIALAKQAVERDPANPQYRSWLGALQLRAGQIEESLATLEFADECQPMEKTSRAYIFYFRAMAEHRLRRREDAHKSLANANELAEQHLKDSAHPPAWNRKVTLEILRREATFLLDRPADAR